MNAMRLNNYDGSSPPRTGTISSYDPGSHSVKVTIQPDGFDTGWIQLNAIGVGKGWGVLTGPQIGDEVTVSFDQGDPNLGRITGRHFSSENPPPAVPSGETWIVHESGSLLKFNTDGTVTLHSVGALGVESEAVINYDAPQHNFTGGPVAMDHTLTVTGGDVLTDQDVKAGTISLKTHPHAGPPSAPPGPVSNVGVPLSS